MFGGYCTKTPTGYEIRVTGNNRQFAKYAGIGMVGSMITAQLIGGALAGIGGTIEILGRYDRFLWMEQTNYGFDGLMIAVIARNNPALVPFSGIFDGIFKSSANVAGATTDVPMEFINMIQAIIILLIAATMFLESVRKRAVVKLSMAEMEAKNVRPISDKREYLVDFGFSIIRISTPLIYMCHGCTDIQTCRCDQYGDGRHHVDCVFACCNF